MTVKNLLMGAEGGGEGGADLSGTCGYTTDAFEIYLS